MIDDAEDLPASLDEASLNRLAEIINEAAEHALGHYTAEEWADPAFGAILLNAAKTLRDARRSLSAPLIEAMKRSSAALTAQGCASA